MWWLLLLFVVAICMESGKVGVWIALIVALFSFLSLISMGVGMIYPWPQQQNVWVDDAAEPSWRYLIHARHLAEQWALSRWGSKRAAAVAGWGGLILALLSFLAFVVFEAEALLPHSQYPKMAATWLLWLLLGASVLLFCFSFLKIKVPDVKTPEEIIRGGLHGEMVLLGQWRTLCGSVPLPFSLWRYFRLLIPVGGWAYHYFFLDGRLLALTAVMGVAMAYFAYVMVDLSFDLLAAVNGVAVCPCRSPYLARLVWEAQFLSCRYKPLWARILSDIGL